MREFLTHYRQNTNERIALITRMSFVLNILIGVGKLALGVYLLSSWFAVNAFYYLLLCVARGQALTQLGLVDEIENPQKRYTREISIFKKNGFFVCLIGVSYLLVCLHMYLSGNANNYSNDYIVYGVATVAFTKIGFAIAGIISTRKLKRPILSVIKIISLMDACVSIVLTQCALLVMMKSDHAIESSALFGMAISIVFILFGLLMLFRKKPIAS